MKSVFTLLAVGIFAFAATAQDKMSTTTKDAKAPVEKKMASAEKKFWCTSCDYSSANAGVCPHHKTVMVKEGMYFCKGDEANASAQPGKCKNGSLMTKMDEDLQRKNKELREKAEEKEKIMKRNK